MATGNARPDLQGYALEFRSTTPRFIVENDNPKRAGEAASPSRMPVNTAGSLERPGPPEADLRSEKDASSAEMEDAAHHGPRFVARDGDIEGQGSPYNQTKVDVVLVPCPGADPYDTWTRDRLPRDVFESTFDWNKPNVKARAPTMDSEMFQTSQYIDKSPSWARSGIRKEVGFARVLSYDHGDIPEAATIKQLSMNLLELLRNERQPPRKRRPLFFICHSLGGLVVKLALNLAHRDPCHSATLEDCYGLTFFATPHQGLPDLFRPQSAAHIQQLLGLPKPLPASIGTELLRPDSYLLHDMNIKFREYSSDIHIWTLYETGVSQVSQASESLRYGNAGAQIKPSLTSMGSAILGLRNEIIYPLRSSHTNCASFGIKNLRTMMLYIKELGNAIRKSAAFYENKPAKSLDLEESVLVRVHKFHWDERFHHNKYVKAPYSSECTLNYFLAGGLDDRQGTGHTVRFSWVHQCFNNPIWVERVFETVGLLGLLNPGHWKSRQEGGRHSQPHAWFLKPSCASIPRNPGFWKEKSEQSSTSERASLIQCPSRSFDLYMPFLHFDTYKAIVKRRALISRRLFQGLRKPVPLDILNEPSLESRVIWEYLDRDPPINIRRTLDQFRHPSLDTKARDDDQVLYKMTKARFEDFGVPGEKNIYSGGSGLASDDGDAILGEMVMNNSQPDDYDDEEEEFDILNGNILMVDQLWMWVIDNGEEENVVTCFPGREGDPMDGPLFDEADLHNSIFNELHGNEFSPCENAFDLAALIVLHAVTILLGRSSNPDLEVFRLFDEAISLLTERITHLLKVLEASAWGGAYGLGDDLTNPNISIQEKHKQENVRARLEYRNNTSTLLALRDIEDELSIMKRLFSEQEQQITKMISIYDKMEAAPITRGKSSLQEALAAVQSYHFRSDDMISRTRKVLLDFDRLLDLFERRTQGEEGRLARHNADLGAAQNRIMLIFTVFTVIFLPLSFFTSLFGMNTREWGGGDNLSLSTIVLIVFPTSAFLIVCAIAGAWMASGSMNYLSMERYTRTPKRWWGKLINLGVYDDDNPRTSHARRGTQRKHEAPGHKRRKDTMMEEVLMLDFWDSHRLQREHDHHKIPVGNRKSTRIAMARAMAKKEKREGQGLS